MFKLILLRHGESLWNRENRFTGWTDVDLSQKWYAEAKAAGRMIRDAGINLDLAYTSVLRRAIRTLWEVQEVMDCLWLPVVKDWRLNERHYGALQGLNKVEMAEHYGEEQVHNWRRGYAIRPPALNTSDPRHPRFDPRYRGMASHHLPATESLADTLLRVVETWEEDILPRLKSGKRILIAAHGNSLRALVKHLEHVSEADIMELNIPTGIPLVFEFNSVMQVVARYYLADDATVQAATHAVAKQAAVVHAPG
jgi:2,3-bisphosphoglycerate-dependent phosphoglycerate mutase